ncbi:hypothetical protein BJV77DRAFT_1065073 [Russula vinacea]|nr:hypothetical protein BJV77DRAFT_1065073 [Russula vinacea]
MFSPEQKNQLLTNLDIEVAHRTRQLESWLSDTLAAFRDRHERQLAYIPHLVRGMTMAEFGDKYDGDVQAALRGLQKERLIVDVAPLDRNAMKRKWAPVPEEEETETGQGTLVKIPGLLNIKKPPPFPPNIPPSRMPAPRTPGTSRVTAQTPSPRKLARIPSAPLFRAGTTPAPSSPTKPTAASLARQVVRVPSTSTFKPAIPQPPKTPAFPPPPRWPRKDESMLSLNGSPLTNPYELGLEWLAEDDTGDGEEGMCRPDDAQTHRDTSNSQSQTQLVRSRSESRPVGSSTIAAASMAARVAFPTRDGHLLEFNPLLTSPGELDKLEGITDSAKKQAKEDMSKLVQAAVAKWTVK